MTDDYQSAESDLTWFYADSSAAIGFHGQSGEPGTTSVFDELASWELHDTKHSYRHRMAAARLRRITPLIAAMGSEHRTVAELAFTPHAWPNALRIAFTVRRGICLVSLALRAKSCARLRDVRNRKESPLEFLTFETGQCNLAKRLPQRLVVVRDEAQSMLDAALSAYESAQAGQFAIAS